MDEQLLEDLKCLRLEQYLATFEKNHYTSWDRLRLLTEGDMDRLGVKIGHGRRLQRKIATMEGYPKSMALSSSGTDESQDTFTAVGSSLSLYYLQIALTRIQRH